MTGILRLEEYSSFTLNNEILHWIVIAEWIASE
jgi:hypothetical protein